MEISTIYLYLRMKVLTLKNGRLEGDEKLTKKDEEKD